MKGPIARGTIRTTFVLGLRLLVQAGTLLLVARMLGPHQFGAFAGVAALAIILGTLSTLGTHLILVGEMSKDPARREEVLRFALPTTLLCGAALLAAYLAICATLLREAKVPPVSLLAIGSAEVLLQPLVTLLSAEHLALGRIARSQMLQALAPSMRLLAATAIYLLDTADPLQAYTTAYLITSLLTLAVASATVPGPLPHPARWRLLHRREMGEAVSYAIVNITKASPAELDKTLAAKLLPLTFAGVYAASARVIAAATLPVSAMALSSLPHLFRAGKSHRTTRLLRWMFGAAGAYGVALAAALWLAAPIFDWAFGEKYRGIDDMIRWLCVAVPGMSLRLTAGNALLAMKHPLPRIVFETTGLAVLTIIAILLAPSLGPKGMGIALSASEWAMALAGTGLTFVIIRRTLAAGSG